MIALLLAACGAPSPGFYDGPVDDLAAREAGDVLRFEHVTEVDALTIGAKAGTSSPHGASVWRILYRTVGPEGEPDVASARLAVPTGDPPEGAAIVAHLHGTMGLADDCAPSRVGARLGFESSSNPNAARMLAQGHVVVEPDYLGLGTPGPHPYVAAAPTGTSVLDAVRAAARFDHGLVLSGAVALEGHSQGGHAVLAALSTAESHAPELDLVAAVAIAPPGAHGDLLQRLFDEERHAGFVAMALSGLSAAHPDLPPADDWLLPDLADEVLDDLDRKCLVGLSGLLDRRPDDLFRADVVTAAEVGDWEALGLADVLAGEDLGALATDVPLLVVHGTDDPLLPLDLTEDLVARIAANGTPVELLAIDGGDHLLLPSLARDDVFGFLDARLP